MILQNPTPHAFVAYSARPQELSDSIKRAIQSANENSTTMAFKGWAENDIAGRPLTGPILEKIGTSSFVVSDITQLNFNVTYEIGFTIGSGKRVFLVRNKSYENDITQISRVGIYDTLGYREYTNSEKLANILLVETNDHHPIDIHYKLDRKAPIYILETPDRNDIMNRITSRIKKARLQYRSFNPSEEIRLAATEAIKHISTAHGVIVPLLSDLMKDHIIHNIRAAFVAGLAHGMGKPTLILQDHNGPVPLDVRDFCKVCSRIEDVDTHIREIALEVVQSLQESGPYYAPDRGILAKLDVGDPMAENEFQTLASYYLRRDEYSRTLRGDVNLVVGRKGAGKTALFSQVRNNLRRNRATVVVDLKPEGYQLTKFKESVLDFLSAGAKSHLLTAFWEYLLFLEVAYKLLEKDKNQYMRNHEICSPYLELNECYCQSPSAIQSDFSERLMELSSNLSEKYRTMFGDSPDRQLITDEITEIVHAGNLLELRKRVCNYLKFKDDVWILFDNLDKGWNVPGPSPSDILILRTLIDASRKIQRDMQRDGFKFYCVVFVRNDVYQLLMHESPDFGKEMRVSLDWSDADMLREMIRLRLVTNGYNKDDQFADIWPSLCISHIGTEETSQFMIERCLMRPRNLLKIFCHCKGFAVNLGHTKIEDGDIKKGILAYSNDLLLEANLELSNIDSDAEGLIYHFRGEDWRFTKEEVLILFEEHGLSSEKYDEVLMFFLYFGFFGLLNRNENVLYIHNVGYDMKVLEVQISKSGKNLEYALNPAFWPALRVGPEGYAGRIDN